MLHEFDCYFYKIEKRNYESLPKTFNIQKAKKRVWAENEDMARKIAECIASHDGKVWRCPIDYDFIDVSLPLSNSSQQVFNV